MEDKKFISLNGLQHYDNNVKEYICNELEPLEPLQQSRTLCELLFNPVDLAQYAIPNNHIDKTVPNAYINMLKIRKPLGLFYYAGNTVYSAYKSDDDMVLDLIDFANFERYYIIIRSNNKIIDSIHAEPFRIHITTDLFSGYLDRCQCHYTLPGSMCHDTIYEEDDNLLSYTLSDSDDYNYSEGWIKLAYGENISIPNTCFAIIDYYGSEQLISKQCFSNNIFKDESYKLYKKNTITTNITVSDYVFENFPGTFYVVADFCAENVNPDYNFLLVERLNNDTDNYLYLYENSYCIFVYNQYDIQLGPEEVQLWVNNEMNFNMGDLYDETYNSFGDEYQMFINGKLFPNSHYEDHKIIRLPINVANSGDTELLLEYV